MRPSNWQEMQIAIIKELQEKIDELHERADEIEMLKNSFRNSAWAYFMIFPDKRRANDYGDLDRLSHLQEAIANWPDVTTVPGEGYW